jgi:hypothetical protein
VSFSHVCVSNFFDTHACRFLRVESTRHFLLCTCKNHYTMPVNITHHACEHHTLCVWTSHTMRVNITHYACEHHIICVWTSHTMCVSITDNVCEHHTLNVWTSNYAHIYVCSENLLQYNVADLFFLLILGGGGIITSITFMDPRLL